jgi:hypothetical protein
VLSTADASLPVPKGLFWEFAASIPAARPKARNRSGSHRRH